MPASWKPSGRLVEAGSHVVEEAHFPLESQVWPVGQVPQEPPHPSGPQDLPLQLGAQEVLHFPLESQLRPVGQVPQDPPQPSEPQDLPLQFRVQDDVLHLPLESQLRPLLQPLQIPPQPSERQAESLVVEAHAALQSLWLHCRHAALQSEPSHCQGAQRGQHSSTHFPE